MGQYYAGLVPTTKALQEYTQRGQEKALMWAPSRMVDAAEEMLASYQRNDNDGLPTRPVQMPIVLCAMAKDYTQTMRDYTTQIPDDVLVSFPDDERERAFKLRTMAADVRTQIAFFAHDIETARGLVSQFALFLDSPARRRFFATYTFNLMDSRWPVQIENTDVVAMAVATEAKNLNILVVDLTLKATIPLFSAPALLPETGDYDPLQIDHSGGPATDDLPGFVGVQEVTANGETIAKVED